MLGAAGVGGVGCGRFGATVVLHARCTPKITHHLGSPGGHNVSASHDHVQTGAPRRGAAAWSVMSCAVIASTAWVSAAAASPVAFLRCRGQRPEGSEYQLGRW